MDPGSNKTTSCGIQLKNGKMLAEKLNQCICQRKRTLRAFKLQHYIYISLRCVRCNKQATQNNVHDFVWDHVFTWLKVRKFFFVAHNTLNLVHRVLGQLLVGKSGAAPYPKL